MIFYEASRVSVTRVPFDREIASFEKKLTFENERLNSIGKILNIVDFNEFAVFY